MGSRDYGKKEKKKLKKDANKIVSTPIITQPPATVEVFKKKRKIREEAPPEE
jgi:hypothetical protein